MRILLVKMSSMGDVIHTFPAVTDALARLPGLELDWAVEPAFVELARLHPGVGTVWPTAVRRWRRKPFDPITRMEFRHLKEALRKRRYDRVIDAQGLLKSAFVARLPGVKVDGFDRRSAREPIASLAYARRHGVSRSLHAVDRTRLLLGRALGYEPDLAVLRTGIERDRATGDPRRAVLLHGTTWSSKRWPSAAWIRLARALADRGYRPELTFSDVEEEFAAAAIAGAVPEAVVHPRRPLGAVAEWIAGADVAIGVDTGLTHLAAALGVPTVALFASTRPGLTGPRGRAAEALAATISCAPCMKRTCPLVPAGGEPPCHATIGPDRVLAEIARLTS